MALQKYQKELVLAIVFSLFLFSPAAHAAGVKVKVIVENASLRLQPTMESEIIEENVAMGTIFEAVKKEGEWFEIKFRSRVGVLLTGYIHEMYVEEVKKKPKKEAVKEPSKPVVPLKAPVRPPQKAVPKRLEIFLGPGLGLSSFLNDSSRYSRNWNEPINYNVTLLSSVSESGTIRHQFKNPIGFGFSLSYFFARGFGAQLRVDPHFSSVPSATKSQFDMTWTWMTTGKTYSDQKNWNTEGSLSIIPISFNLILQMRRGGFLVPYFSAGISYFQAKVKVNSTRGYGLSWMVERLPNIDQYIDFINVPVKVDKSLSSLGFNIGGGLDLRFSSSIAWSIGAVYFIGKKHEEYWNIQAGEYYPDYYQDVIITLYESGAEAMRKEVTRLEINLSFLKIFTGIKILF
ncbi:MAG: outer membrane beta-barrel protein [Candidatus Aminicenantales bacterium]